MQRTALNLFGKCPVDDAYCEVEEILVLLFREKPVKRALDKTMDGNRLEVYDPKIYIDQTKISQRVHSIYESSQKSVEAVLKDCFGYSTRRHHDRILVRLLIAVIVAQ